ncbi:mitochondrial ribosomal protein [Colletotrichum plurivorum]|uniref:Mitochondrial ribosomal protein n=1 Tax=Colletotrichum plurivorum TaxID=2175906 RepID=A0A8H6NIT1_9PEZI|nr:mitochondrial ribosomal protein [Colletotrichum plurivorum]
MRPTAPTALLSAFQGLRISAAPSIKTFTAAIRPQLATPLVATQILRDVRPFSSTTARQGTWLEPSIDRTKKMMKGRPRVATGGSTKGTTVIWGDYGLRMKDHHRRISARQLKIAEDTIKMRLRGQKYRLYKRICCNVGVYVSGNEMRMGKGKGSFDHWAARVAVNQIVFEIRGMLHEAVAKDAFRLAGNKLPGQWEFVQKGEPPVVGITKLDGITLEELKRPRKQIAPKDLLAEASSKPTTAASESASAKP